MTSSLLETSEDEREKKAKEEEKAKKAAKKGLSEKQLNEDISIELCETETMTNTWCVCQWRERRRVCTNYQGKQNLPGTMR